MLIVLYVYESPILSAGYNNYYTYILRVFMYDYLFYNLNREFLFR